MPTASIKLRTALLSGSSLPWVERHPRARYMKDFALSVPDWADRVAINAIYKEAQRRSRASAQRCVVDHIIPLRHPQVCGLTVPGNLRIVTERENARRSNRWWEFTPDLFDFVEQLRLF